ncbi:MAG: 2-oxoglutarate dehydrogenase complex dihydrolipoyllysine-residue succinyltransferase [Deltaproteobacteria bacterium]|nr:2-oxoglutarate dehydrogenase complex dihydrolipoyllysine-residue succinyltransferase [Deltaproteobacteria bacterium]
MKVQLKVPDIGESVKEAILVQWYGQEGDFVNADEPVFALETDKVTLEVPAEVSGTLHIMVAEGATVAVAQVVGEIDDKAARDTDKTDKKAPSKTPAPVKAPTPSEKPPAPVPESGQESGSPPDLEEPIHSRQPGLFPSVRQLVKKTGIDIQKVTGTGPGGRVTRGDILLYLESGAEKPAPEDKTGDKPISAGKKEQKTKPMAGDRITRRTMSPMRKRIASHLLAAKQKTAMLTTFNEIDMSRVTQLRNRYKDAFFKSKQVRLGFMSFFIKAAVAALTEFPDVNAMIDNDEIVYHHYYHIGVAIGAEKGLVVPVIRNADRLGFAEIESAIVEFVKKIKGNHLKVSDLEGGTFSITNGGIYGSLMSTPILNMPQSAILGMHKIEERPVAVNREVVIRPMMYVALSYDHRIVDGKIAVTFLRRIKEFVENPERMMMEI